MKIILLKLGIVKYISYFCYKLQYCVFLASKFKKVKKVKKVKRVKRVK